MAKTCLDFYLVEFGLKSENSSILIFPVPKVFQLSLCVCAASPAQDTYIHTHTHTHTYTLVHAVYIPLQNNF